MAYRDQVFLLSLFLGILFIGSTYSEFRFCLNGPQKILEEDCAGGLLLNKPIDSPCIIMARRDKIKLHKASLNSSLCGINGDSSAIESTRTDTEETLAKEGETSFQYVLFEVDAQSDAEAATSSLTGITILDKENCMKECLKDWIDPSQDLDEEPEYDFGIPGAPAETVKEQTQLTQDLFTYMNFDYDTASNLRDLNIFNVLREALNVLEKHCRPPYVDPIFISHIFAAFRYVVIKTEARTKINDLGTREHSLIVDSLRKCKDNPMKFFINGSTCGDSSRIRTIDNLSYRRDGKAWRWGKFDIMIEAAWSAIEFVHGYCFKEYSTDLSFQHLLIKAMDALFSNKVQMRWMYPTKLKDDAYWENMVGIKDANLTMRNIDFCVQGSRPLSPYNDRLGRPFERQPGTYTPAAPTAVDTPKAGWPNDNLDEYWTKYEAKGGIRSAILPYGYCGSSTADLSSRLEKTLQNCPKDPTDIEDEDEYY